MCNHAQMPYHTGTTLHFSQLAAFVSSVCGCHVQSSHGWMPVVARVRHVAAFQCAVASSAGTRW